MSEQSQFIVTCVCGAMVCTPTTQAKCKCGRQIQIEWESPEANAPKMRTSTAFRPLILLLGVVPERRKSIRLPVAS
jgi:hypothetical protein